MEYWIGLGADRTVIDGRGLTLLDYACFSKSKNMVLKVLEFDDHQTIYHSWSPLHWACRKGNFEIIRHLVDAGITASVVLTTESSISWTPLDVAIYHRNRNLVSSDGVLHDSHPWSVVVHSGIVRRDS